MKKQMLAFDLGHGIALTMPRSPTSRDVMSAFILLGGLLYHDLISNDPKAKEIFPEAMERCFDFIRKGDFSELAKEVRKVAVFEAGEAAEA